MPSHEDPIRSAISRPTCAKTAFRFDSGPAQTVKYAATNTGAWWPGQIMATSFVVLSPFDPVLSLTRQPLLRPARNRSSPVLFAISHAMSCSREAGDSLLPTTKLSMFPAIAAGDVVSRGSPGSASFNAVSTRSNRVTVSPSERAKRVIPGGPPIELLYISGRGPVTQGGNSEKA
jgi:hypothetical protein